MKFFRTIKLALGFALLLGIASAAQITTRTPMHQTASANPLPQISLRAPVAPMSTACCALAKSSDHVLALVQCGKLRWAFDISAGDGAYREIRILSLCLADYQAGRRTSIPGFGNEFDLVLGVLFPMVTIRPGAVTKLKVATIAQRLVVRSDVILKLARAGWLEFSPGTKCRRGPSGSPEILFSAVASFLKSRRIA